MKQTIILVLLFTLALGGCGVDKRYVMMYPQYKPFKKDSIVPAVQIFKLDTKDKEIGIMFDTPEFVFRTTGDEPLKIFVSKDSRDLNVRNLFLSVESKETHCIDIEKEVNFYFADGTFMKYAPDNDGGDPCESFVFFNIFSEFRDPDIKKLWIKLLHVPLEEIRIIMQTKESNSIQQGLTKVQGLALMKSVQMLDTATTGIQRVE